MTFRKGIVVAVHPRDHSVDILMADDGARLTGVQVMTGNGSTRTGLVDLPEIKKTGDKWDISADSGQELHAIVGFVGINPVVVGFLYPQVNQMTFDDPKLKLERHQSDVIHTIDGDGNMQWTHPSGWFLRVGTSPEKIDYSDRNFDKNLKTDRNNEKSQYVRLHMKDGTAVLTIEPNGKVILTTENDIEFTADGKITYSAGNDILIQSGTHITMLAPKIDLN